MTEHEPQNKQLTEGSMWETAYISCGVNKIEKDRPKTYQVIKRILKSIDKQGQGFSLDDVGAIVAPRKEDRGLCYPVKSPSNVIIYFAPSLEELPESDLNYVVAHEFAHIALKHNRIKEDEADLHQIEIEADQQAIKWGFGKKFEKEKIQRKTGVPLGAFLTANGFLAAILLVWATLWTTSAQLYDTRHASMYTIALGLIYIYWALLASLIAFVISLFRASVGRIAILSMAFSLTITMLEVLFSLVAVIWKMMPTLIFGSRYKTLQVLYH